jgi:putative transposase
MSRQFLTFPQGWKRAVKSAELTAISLAQYAIVRARAQIEQDGGSTTRFISHIDRLKQEIALLTEENRILHSRIDSIPPHRRPQYKPIERMAILELRATRCWSLAETAQRFLVTAETISAWLTRIDDCDKPLLQLREPVNKFPQYVHYIVQRLKTLCPALGKAKIAQKLARAGLHLGVPTVGRILNSVPANDPTETKPKESEEKKRIVTAKHPNHVWHVDLTIIPIGGGFWTAWLPFSLPQWWPFCYWLCVVVDHYSRRAMTIETFRKQPTSKDVQACLDQAMKRACAKPKHLISDRGCQFDCHSFRKWAKRRKIKLRYGAVGKHGSIAVVERFIRTLKEMIRTIIIPYDEDKFDSELDFIAGWYNESRPHEFLKGKTPNEVYFKMFPKNRCPRFEPRSKYPRGSPCALPWSLVKGKPGAKLELEVEFQHGRKHLPIVTLKRIA